MNYNEMQMAIEDAERTLYQADRAAGVIAHLMIGRLRKVGSQWVLVALKKELKNYNMQTGQWRD